MLVLMTAPGDESLFCSTMIGSECARGRPPFVAVLTDGGGSDALAFARTRQSFQAVKALGVPDEWFQMLGLRFGTASISGQHFDAVVKALAMIMWRRDCNKIAVPWASDTRQDYAAAHAIGRALAVDDSGLATYQTFTPSGHSSDGAA